MPEQRSTQQSLHRHHWQLNPDIIFLNHGSFGATPTVVLEQQQHFRAALESEPIQFLAPERKLEPKLDRVREIVATQVHCDSQDLAFVRNVTDGVNAVLRSFPFESGDEIVITNLGYNACNNAARFAADKSNAVVREAVLPFPIQDPAEIVTAIEAKFTDRTRLLLVDHVTSATGLVLPIKEIVHRAKERGIRVLVDGAHALGMVDIDLESIGADYYTANHHKWLCGPKTSGMLWVKRDLQHEVRPTVISHGANRSRPNRSRFLAEFDWMGTFDPTPILALESSIHLLSNLVPGGFDGLKNANRQLALQARELLTGVLGIDPPAPAEMIGSLVTLPLPTLDSAEDPLKMALIEKHGIEVPIFGGPESAPRLLRTSSHAYNHIGDYQRLAEVLSAQL